MASVLLTTAPAAQAQQPAKKIARVAILSLTPAPVQKDRIEAFREALRKLGHFEGQNINFEYRYGDNKSERMAGLAGRTRRAESRCDCHHGKWSDPTCQRSNQTNSHRHDGG